MEADGKRYLKVLTKWMGIIEETSLRRAQFYKDSSGIIIHQVVHGPQYSPALDDDLVPGLLSVLKKRQRNEWERSTGSCFPAWESVDRSLKCVDYFEWVTPRPGIGTSVNLAAVVKEVTPERLHMHSISFLVRTSYEISQSGSRGEERLFKTNGKLWPSQRR